MPAAKTAAAKPQILGKWRETITIRNILTIKKALVVFRPWRRPDVATSFGPAVQRAKADCLPRASLRDYVEYMNRAAIHHLDNNLKYRNFPLDGELPKAPVAA